MVTSAFFGTEYSSDAFKLGQCIMTLGSSAGAKYNVPNDNSFEVGVAIYPQKDLNNPQVIQQGTNVSLFKCADAQEELAGWLFLKYLTNYESALIWVTGFDEYQNLAGEIIDAAEGTSYFPIRKDVYESQKYQDYVAGKEVDAQGNVKYNPTVKNLAAKIGFDQSEWFYTNVAFDGSSIARDEVENLVSRLLYNDHSGKNIDDVINELYKKTVDTILYG